MSTSRRAGTMTEQSGSVARSCVGCSFSAFVPAIAPLMGVKPLAPHWGSLQSMAGHRVDRAIEGVRAWGS